MKHGRTGGRPKHRDSAHGKDANAEMMTVEEVAKYLRIHRSTLYDMLKAGRLPALKVGQQYRILRADLAKLKNP